MRPRLAIAASLTCLVLLSGCTLQEAAAPTAKLGGKVMSSDGQVYAGAGVRLDPGDRRTTTDANGTFVFTDLPAGNYDILFEPVDGPDFSVVVKLADGQDASDQLFMPSPAEGPSV